MFRTGVREKRWPKLTLEERFWSKVEKGSMADCWFWTGGVTHSNYGRFQICKGLWKYAHRLSYELSFGEIPAGLEVMHLCHTRYCVNPTHLMVGTHAENIADSVARRKANTVVS